VSLIVSAVPTITGQRLVLTLETDSFAPPAFDELGLSDAEAQVLASSWSEVVGSF